MAPEDLYRALGQVEGQLSALTAAINSHANAVKERLDEFDGRHNELERRTRKVENRQHWYAGAVAAISIAASKFLPGIHST